ncbi:conserved hypothetical protein [Candidatus Desulforudis audaxviator MP104C]|uniref:DUF2007 domain-containing protein n=1 Tax=Desulforudis audaxviator (strain MP104C) TaxID=477974 RepID=B1I3G6_DESAP|nr:conserved hypothetical protein [Candidatus Desulforudis audaxviator MP104C]
MEAFPVWTVVYITPNVTEAETIRDHLSREGVLVRLRKIGPEDGDGQSLEILVPEAEVGEALEVLNTL